VSVPRVVLVAIARAVERQGGDIDDVADLLDVWQRLDADGRGRVERMRHEARTVRCCCASGAEIGAGGRCTRCQGWPT
jgi:hypothetical protein